MVALRRILLATVLLAGCGKADANPPDAAATLALRAADAEVSVDAGAAVASKNARIDETALPKTSSEELVARMRHLVEALATNSPDLAGDVLFPRDAYVSLRDSNDAARAWEKTVSEPFRHAVERMFKRTPGMARAKFVAFELGAAVVQLPPKKREWLKPLWRVKHSVLTFTIDGRTRRLDIAEMTAWRGAWYVTRLR